MTDLIKLRELAGKATQEGWLSEGHNVFTTTQICCGMGYHSCCGEPQTDQLHVAYTGDEANAAFIAAANPAAIIALIDALEAANKRIAELEEAQKIAAQIMINSAQILDVVKGEWTKDNSWSTWDQSVRDSYTVFLRAAESNNKKAPNP